MPERDNAFLSEFNIVFNNKKRKGETVYLICSRNSFSFLENAF